MAYPMKKVFLFIVEGISDKNLLEPLIDQIIDTKRIHIEYTNGDITALTDSNQIKAKLGNVIREFKETNRSLANYVEKVIFITDTDGCFIEDTSIKYSKRDFVFRYEDDGIYTNDIEGAKRRNLFKSRNLSMLSSSEKIARLPLETYYFSCNLDRVFYNERNLSNALKCDYAVDFADKYDENKSGFITFFSDNKLTLSNCYNDSWNSIKEGLNSLFRYSNFHLFFISNREFLSEQYKTCINETYLSEN